MSDAVIEVHNLHRHFSNVHAVNGLSFTIPRGQVVGFIGANGAGKTTTMRIMATLDTPTVGSVRICGIDAVESPALVRAKIGWMPDHFGTYDNVTVWEYLDFFGRAFGFRRAERATRLQEVMDFTDLNPLSQREIKKLSKGQTQRLCLARTLLHDPEVLILDEPAAGLDPKARIEFKQLVNLLAKEGKTLFISSHILSELGEMCDSLLFIDAGRLVHHGSSEDLKRHDGGVLVEIQVMDSVQRLADWIAVNPGLEVVETFNRGIRARLDDSSDEAVSQLLRRMVTAGIPVLAYHRLERRLEDAFVDMIRKIEKKAPAPPPALPLTAAPPPLPPNS